MSESLAYPEHELPSDVSLVAHYLNEASREPLLSAEEEVDLAKQIEAGLFAERVKSGEYQLDMVDGPTDEELDYLVEAGRAADDRMHRANLRLVISIAKRYHRWQSTSFEQLDMIQEGNLGLNRAVQKFDYQRGYKFSTYATWWIRQSITRGHADQARNIRLPVHKVEEISKLQRTERQLTVDLGREPTVDELAAHAKLSVEQVADLQSLAHHTTSLQAQLGDELELGDILVESVDGPAEYADYHATADALTRLIDSCLTEREAFVLRMRMGLADGQVHKLDSIGKMLDLTRERIRQIEKIAITKLKQATADQSLSDYL